MLDIIRRHNRLNGIVFSVVEFGLIALFGGSYAVYYVVHYRLILSLIAWGITLNCAPVVFVGVQQWAGDRAHGTAAPSFWNRKVRQQYIRENPRMFRDTLLLTVGTLLPFVSLAAIVLDLLRSVPPRR